LIVDEVIVEKRWLLCEIPALLTKVHIRKAR
jgi:hypothetical protein